MISKEYVEDGSNNGWKVCLMSVHCVISTEYKIMALCIMLEVLDFVIYNYIIYNQFFTKASIRVHLPIIMGCRSLILLSYIIIYTLLFLLTIAGTFYNCRHGHGW